MQVYKRTYQQISSLFEAIQLSRMENNGQGILGKWLMRIEGCEIGYSQAYIHGAPQFGDMRSAHEEKLLSFTKISLSAAHGSVSSSSIWPLARGKCYG